jgi:hypothetical protein
MGSVYQISLTSYIDERYDDTFESVRSSLEAMIRTNPDVTEQHIRGILKNLYIRQGNDWTGRGAIGNAGLDASIAAYECILAELKYRSNEEKGDQLDERQT